MREKQKFWLTVAVFGGAVVLLSGGIYYFLWYSQVQPLQKEIKELESTVQDMQQKIDQIPAKRKTRNDLRKQKKAFQEKLLSLEESDPETLYEELNALAFRANVEHTKYEAESQQQNRGRRGAGSSSVYQKKSFSIEVYGPIWNLFEYIWLIENQNRLLRIESFQLEVEKTDVPAGRYYSGRGRGANAGNNEENTVKMYIGNLSLTLAAFVQQ